MRVVVTGGTGFIGSSVVRLLRAAKHEVRLLVRTGSQTDHLGAHDLELVEGDILEPGSLTSTFQGFDCVVHIAGSLGRDPRSRRETWRVNVDGTVNVMNAALAARVPKVVYTSRVEPTATRPAIGRLGRTSPPMSAPSTRRSARRAASRGAASSSSR